MEHSPISDSHRIVNVAVQVLPLTDDAIEYVERAIAAIQEAAEETGLTVEVGPLETIIEGPFDDAFEAARAAHVATIEAGVPHVVTLIKLADGAQGGMTIDEKTSQYRK